MNILGVAFLSDASAAVLRDGKLVAAISEERINRTKLWNGIPYQAIESALQLSGLQMEDIDLIATHGLAPAEPDPEPFQAKERAIRESGLDEEKKKLQLASLQERLEHERNVLGTRTPSYLEQIKALGRPVRVLKHHEAHAACAYFGSGWEECLVLTIDGWGEDASSTLWQGKSGRLTPLSRSHTFDSLGYFYGSITKSLGFIPHRHEGKVLGLAAYCQAPSRSYPVIRRMVDYDSREKRFVGRMENGLYRPRFENPMLKEFVKDYPREDIAQAAQKTLEEVVSACVSDYNGSSHYLALAGGVFANVKLNQRLRELPGIKEVYVFPNMGDGGLSVGAAWLAHVENTGRIPEPFVTPCLGPEPSEKEIAQVLSASGGLYYKHYPQIEEKIGELLAEGQMVARFAGRMEFGPRALGNRSILYQATDPSVNSWLNERLNRSEFMPFAPATLEECTEQCYRGLDGGRKCASTMTMTFDCTEKMRRLSPAAIHVDGTARPQVVSAREYPEFHRILTAYFRRTGIPSLINTSFNMHEEPIVYSAADALRAFMLAELPYLALGNFLVERKENIL